MLVIAVAVLLLLYLLSQVRAGYAPRVPDSLRSFNKQVHGIFHKNADGSSRQKIIRDCSEGEQLQLIPEPAG